MTEKCLLLRASFRFVFLFMLLQLHEYILIFHCVGLI